MTQPNIRRVFTLAAVTLMAGCYVEVPTVKVVAGGGGGGGAPAPAAPSPTGGGDAVVVEEGGGHSIEGVAILANEGELSGHWYNGTWGDMAFRLEPGGILRGAYTHGDGTVIGHYRGGIMRGWWTERSRHGDSDSGEVEFRFVRVGDGTVQIDGRWCYGHSKAWHDDWDMTKRSPESPRPLVLRLGDPGAFPGEG